MDACGIVASLAGLAAGFILGTVIFGWVILKIMNERGIRADKWILNKDGTRYVLKDGIGFWKKGKKEERN